jgi:adenylylsulfate kinase-like enzyme
VGERPRDGLRDAKGLYAKAARGAMQGLTGAGAPYEPPRAADIVLKTDEESVDIAVSRLEAFLRLA